MADNEPDAVELLIDAARRQLMEARDGPQIRRDNTKIITIEEMEALGDMRKALERLGRAPDRKPDPARQAKGYKQLIERRIRDLGLHDDDGDLLGSTDD